MDNFKMLFITIIIGLFTIPSFAEKINPSNKTDSIVSKDVDYTQDTFLSSRVINGHSTEGTTQGRLDFRIEHRFDVINHSRIVFFCRF